MIAILKILVMPLLMILAVAGSYYVAGLYNPSQTAEIWTTPRLLPTAPEVGEVAPDFTLKYLDSEEEATLSDFKGEKNVVLIFGSYT
ncbi:hypothetical protein IIA79_04635 [bacterium]|nr:hypothetical protein [bacterium]